MIPGFLWIKHSKGCKHKAIVVVIGYQTGTEPTSLSPIMEPSDPKKEKDPWTKENSKAFEAKDVSKYYDPCQEAAERTYRCLTRNDGDREFCRDYFEYDHSVNHTQYRDCKKQWTAKWREEKAKNFFNWS
ncbi:hypothetical protein BT63DRAFT_458414 [Microthyrium microscopicum]|uniref:Cytochrome c oxidase-assembly factor COX23, mitochondrial n=1 Tax=Microthyrium microscopicum TaxID=703497 RepID=A0A6A6U191_9PEZI|nr:hypothetical protein BT63DRAFT_458414 [Microthyrium microscopicum]